MSNEQIQRWKDRMKDLESIIFIEQRFDESMHLLKSLHAEVHSSQITSATGHTLDDLLWDNLDEDCFRTLLSEERVTIAWSIYHIARIEDMTMNVLVGNRNQIFLEDNWQARLHCPIIHTGNALTTKEMEGLSANLDMTEIRNYRNRVGERTTSIIDELRFADLRRATWASDLQRIADEGGVKEEALDILDFWGSNAVAGLLYMPASYHNLHHISKSIELKEKYQRG